MSGWINQSISTFAESNVCIHNASEVVLAPIIIIIIIIIIITGRENKEFTAPKVPTQCPLVLLTEVSWKTR